MFRNKKVTTNQQDNKDDDIILIHDKIHKYFVEERSKKYFYIESIKEIIKILSSHKIPYGIQVDKIENINYKLEQFDPTLGIISYSEQGTDISYKLYINYLDSIQSILSHVSSLELNQQVYNIDTMQLIDDYKELIKNPNLGSFMSKKKTIDNSITQDYSKQIQLLIIKFNNKIQELIENGCIFTNPTVIIKSKSQKANINFVQSQDVYNTITISNNKKRKEIITRKKKICDCIKKEENKITNQDNSSQVTCAECGTIYNINFSENNNFYDYSRINVNQKYHYEKKCHFRDTINQYQGKQNKYIPEEVFQNLEEMLEKHGLIPKEDPKVDKLKRFQKVTKEHIRTFLTETGFQKYYEDLHLIYSKLTGKPRTDISKYEKALYEDFDKLVKIYLTLKLKRKNFLNSHYVLRQLLLKHGVKVPQDDLSCLKTQQRLQEHDDIYQRCCELLNWNFTPMK